MLLNGNLKNLAASTAMSALQKSSELWSRNLLSLMNQTYTSNRHFLTIGSQHRALSNQILSSKHQTFNCQHGILKNHHEAINNHHQFLNINCETFNNCHRNPSSQYRTFSTRQRSVNLPSSTHIKIDPSNKTHSNPGLLSVEGLSGGSVNFIPRRTFISKFMKTFKKSAALIQKQDKVSPEYMLVYSTPQTSTYLKLGLGGVELVATSMVAVAACAMSGVQLHNLDYIYQNPMEAAVFVAVNVVFCLGMLKVIVAHPMRIYYSEKEDLFIAMFVGIHPFAVRQRKIKPGEVRRLPPNKLTETVIPWQTSNYTTSSSKRIYLEAIHFQYPVYYNKLLGYEKKDP